MTSPKKIAHDVVIDYRDESITIDGIAFPFYVLPDPEVSIVSDGSIGVLHIGVLANNLTVVGASGDRKTVTKAPEKVELAWARARADEIVITGLADVLRFVAKGRGAE